MSYKRFNDHVKICIRLIRPKLQCFFFIFLRGELSEHLDSIDSSLDNLQAIFNKQTINFESSPLFDVSVLSLTSNPLRVYCVGI